MDLKQRFYTLTSNYTEDQVLIKSLWNDIYTKYSEHHRTYHNLTHITELFSYFDTYQQQLEHPNIVLFSIFYHDIIYNIWKSDNEEKSADFAVNAVSKLKVSSSFLDQIHQQIVATKTHTASDNDTKWMIDFDLAILGQSEAIYNNYSQLIHKEYKLIPKLIYKKGRKKVLQHFIDKPFIYATNQFKSLYENQAKNNLISELTSL